MSTTENSHLGKRKKTTINTLASMKTRGEKISMVTAYDASFARLIDQASIDVILVGDSLGMVIQGEENTLGVTLEDIVYHSRAVRRAARHAHVVADMPFMTYQAGIDQAVQNAGRLLKEGRAESVKIEGGTEHADLVSRLVAAGIPVMGHLGLTPQSVHAMGGFRVQGKSAHDARRILADAEALERAGCFAIVLEGIPDELAKVITERLGIPTIGIGAGPNCDGQVLVIYDLLGMDHEFRPKFVKAYADLGTIIPNALGAFRDEVKAGSFPAEEHTFHSKDPLFPRLEVVSDPAGDDDDDGLASLYGVPV